MRTPVLQVCCCLFTLVGSWGGRWRAYTISPRLTAGENVYEINMGLMQCSEPCSAVALEASCIIPHLPLSLSFSLSLCRTWAHTHTHTDTYTFPTAMDTKVLIGLMGSNTVNQTWALLLRAHCRGQALPLKSFTRLHRSVKHMYPATLWLKSLRKNFKAQILHAQWWCMSPRVLDSAYQGWRQVWWIEFMAGTVFKLTVLCWTPLTHEHAQLLLLSVQMASCWNWAPDA